MKQCSTCQEEFADKFSFCPVDGTPLNGFASKKIEPTHSEFEETVPSQPAVNESFSVNASETEAYGDEMDASIPESVSAQDDGEYHLTIIDDAGLVSRLTTELREVAHQSQLTWPEFKRDPFGFTKRLFAGYGRMAGGFFSRPNVAIALITALVSMTVLAVGISWVERSQSTGVSKFGIGLFAALALGLLIALFIGWFTRGRAATLKTQGGGPAAGYSSETDMPTVVTAMLASLVFALFIGGAFIWLDQRNKQRQILAEQQDPGLEFQGMVEIPPEQEKPDEGPAGNNKGTGGGSKPKQEKPGGGGGGGREEQKPASFGKLPPGSLDIPQIMAPNPKPPPPVKNPLVVPPTLVGDPMLFPTDPRNLPYGDPKSKSTDPSSGPGKGNGIGTGEGAGVGSGEGGGFGPGRGGNTGGGDFNQGGGGPGGGGGGTDYNKTFKASEVTQKARITSRPAPEYTEEARKNQVTGTVVLSMVLSSSGGVTNIRTVSGLPNGLTEKAIQAARRIQFSPAQKDGRPVSQYIRVEYNFNIY